MRGWIIAVLVAVFPTPAFASFDIICDGKRDTPQVDVKLGSSDQNVYGVDVDGFGTFAQSQVRERKTARRNDMMLDLLRRGRVVATIRLFNSRGERGWYGTMLIGRRKYWLECGEAG